MALCPLCQAAVKDDFGLTECESCGAQLIVHVDGRVEYQGAQVVGSQEEAPSEEPDFVPPPADENIFSLPEDEVMAEPQEPVEPEPEPLPPPVPAPEPDDAMAVVEEPVLEEAAPVLADDLDVPGEPMPEVYQSATSPSSPNLLDVANFGNSDLSGARDGSLRYTVFIEGVDTRDVRQALREALTDRKFMWDTEQILRSVNQGEVTIPNVSASKAFMLISRLRNLPLKVRWEQYAAQQT